MIIPKSSYVITKRFQKFVFSSYNGEIYKEYFITDHKYFISKAKPEDRNHQEIQILEQGISKTEYNEEGDPIYRGEKVNKRIQQMIGFSNFSLAFRNTEHICRYIMSGVWISYQMTTKGKLREVFENYVKINPKRMRRERRKINVLPENLGENESNCNPLLEGADSFLTFKDMQFHLKEEDDVDGTYNIIFLAPSGAGKPDLIDFLFNQEILPLKRGLTRSCKYINGSMRYSLEEEGSKQERSKKIRVVDTIGLCGGDVDDKEIMNVMEDSLRHNLNYVDKVVVCINLRKIITLQ